MAFTTAKNEVREAPHKSGKWRFSLPQRANFFFAPTSDLDSKLSRTLNYRTIKLLTFNNRTTIIRGFNIIIQSTKIIRHYCFTIQAYFRLVLLNWVSIHSEDGQFPAKRFKHTALHLYCISCTQTITIRIHVQVH